MPKKNRQLREIKEVEEEKKSERFTNVDLDLQGSPN
jgi:hypothetical protein